MRQRKKLLFLTGTRADYGKIKSILRIVKASGFFKAHIFITGMHTLSKYGFTAEEVTTDHLFDATYTYINQNHADSMDVILAKTMIGLSDYVKESKPDLIVVHGDRVEALAGALVGSLNNIPVAHIEGGEVSGTVDELLRHAITKLSHIHFVANTRAQQRLLQLGESQASIYVIGSPDIDIMRSSGLPDIKTVQNKYQISFNKYAVVLFHPVTTETNDLKNYTTIFVNALLESQLNYVVIGPNNDLGSDIITRVFEQIIGHARFRYIPSMRFEYFLMLMKCASFVIGNSSAGVREAPIFGVPSINLGTRQRNRSSAKTIINARFCKREILSAVSKAVQIEDRESIFEFGDGTSAEKFLDCITQEKLWKATTQKYFNDLPSLLSTANQNTKEECLL